MREFAAKINRAIYLNLVQWQEQSLRLIIFHFPFSMQARCLLTIKSVRTFQRSITCLLVLNCWHMNGCERWTLKMWIQLSAHYFQEINWQLKHRISCLPLQNCLNFIQKYFNENAANPVIIMAQAISLISWNSSAYSTLFGGSMLYLSHTQRHSQYVRVSSI